MSCPLKFSGQKEKVNHFQLYIHTFWIILCSKIITKTKKNLGSQDVNVNLLYVTTKISIFYDTS